MFAIFKPGDTVRNKVDRVGTVKEIEVTSSTIFALVEYETDTEWELESGLWAVKAARS